MRDLVRSRGLGDVYTRQVFIGLVAPHIARRLAGNQIQHWLPLSALFGGLLLLAADILARQLAFPQELPVGMLTALIGAPWLILPLIHI